MAAKLPPGGQQVVTHEQLRFNNFRVIIRTYCTEEHTICFVTQMKSGQNLFASW